jgi:hypothetical protein
MNRRQLFGLAVAPLALGATKLERDDLSEFVALIERARDRAIEVDAEMRRVDPNDPYDRRNQRVFHCTKYALFKGRWHVESNAQGIMNATRSMRFDTVHEAMGFVERVLDGRWA